MGFIIFSGILNPHTSSNSIYIGLNGSLEVTVTFSGFLMEHWYSTSQHRHYLSMELSYQKNLCTYYSTLLSALLGAFLYLVQMAVPVIALIAD